MINSWRQYRRLSAGEQWILWQALLLLPLVALALHLLGLRRLQGFLGGWLPQLRPAWQLNAQSLSRLVELAARRGLYRANCLQRSLLLWWFLGRQGIPRELKIGVQKVGEQLMAHAWVESNGQVLNDHPGVHQEYSPFHGAIAPPASTQVTHWKIHHP